MAKTLPPAASAGLAKAVGAAALAGLLLAPAATGGVAAAAATPGRGTVLVSGVAGSPAFRVGARPAGQSAAAGGSDGRREGTQGGRGAPRASRSSPARVGQASVWPLWRTGQMAAARACVFSRRPPPDAAQAKPCLERFMRAHGASAAAIAFFAAHGTYLIGLVSAGVVAVGYTLTALPMDCGCFEAALLNGLPRYAAVPPPSLRGSAYARLRRAYRLPSGRTGLAYLLLPPFVEAARPLAGGGERLILQFPLNDVCSACATPYRARVAYRFSPGGALLAQSSLGPCLAPPTPGAGSSRSVPVPEPNCPRVSASPPG